MALELSTEKFFPYKHIRTNQKKFMDDVYASCAESKILLGNAETGIGKTGAVLAATLKYATANGLKVIYVTPNLNQHKTIISEVNAIAANTGEPLSMIDKTNKQSMCRYIKEIRASKKSFAYGCARRCENGCNLKDCKKASSDNCIEPEVWDDALNVASGLCGQCISSKEYTSAVDKLVVDGVCPHFLAYRSFSEADIVVCDYNYVFAPGIQNITLNFALSAKTFEKCILVVDEAHKLPARLRDFSSFLLSVNRMDYCIKSLQASRGSFQFSRTTVLPYLECMRDFIDGFSRNQLVDQSRLNDFMEFRGLSFAGLEMAMAGIKDEEGDDESETQEESITNAVLKVLKFLRAWNSSGEYARHVRIDKYKELHCDNLDVSVISKIINTFHSAVLMSGTLMHQPMYVNVLGLDTTRTTIKDYESDFEPSNRHLLCTSKHSLEFKLRQPQTYKEYGESISEIINSTNRNVGVFFSSYGMLTAITNHIKPIGKTLHNEDSIRSSGTSKESKEKVMEIFSNNPNQVLYASMNGSFSEGVNFSKNSLPIILMCGVPYPNNNDNLFLQELEKHYTKRGWNGREYVIVFPAVLATIQAMGRAIRSHTDVGFIVLMDKRFHGNFGSFKYKFPSSFNPQLVNNASDVNVHMVDFFKKKEIPHPKKERNVEGSK